MINLKTSKQPTLSVPALINLVEKAKAAEICRDKKASLEAFRPIWRDIETDPDFSGIEPPAIRAELYRLAGYFLNFYGKAESRKNCQNRAKRIITEAINLFQDLGLKEKSDEAYIILAICYWDSGDPENCDTVLWQVEEEYADRPFESPYLQAKLTRAVSMWVKEEFDQAMAMIENLNDKMKFSSDKSLKLSFHNKAGAMYVTLGFYDKGINHFQKGIRYADELNNHFLRGSQLNNLAMTYKELAARDSKYFDDAFENVDQAIALFESLDAPGWIAVALETRAGILLRVGRDAEAFETISRSIEMMRRGDDFVALVEALMVRFDIRVKLKDYPAAMLDFSDAVELARRHIGDFKVELLNRKITEKIYFRAESNLIGEVNEFKKHLVKESLLRNKFHRERTASDLGITRAGLYEILEVQFPELYEELNFGKRSRRHPSGKKSVSGDHRQLKLVEPAIKPPPGKKAVVRKMTIPAQNIIYPGKNESLSLKMSCFYFPASPASETAFGSGEDIVMLCDHAAQYTAETGNLVMTHNSASRLYSVAYMELNDVKKDYYLQDFESGADLSPENYKIVGKIIGFCLSGEAVGEVIFFRTLNNV